MDNTVPAGAAVLLDFIRETEVGTTDRSGYDVISAFKQAALPKPVTRMTLKEVQAAQPHFKRRYGATSSATGAYQFMHATLKGLIAELGLHGSQLLDPDLQDRLAYHLLIRRGYHEYAEGRIGRAEFGRRLAMEWASLPVLAGCRGAHRKLVRGQSYYAGDGLNKALVPAAKLEAVLDDVKAAAARLPEIEHVEIEKPVVMDPESLDKPMPKSKTVWMWLTTALGAPFLAFAKLDWRVQLAIVAVIVLFAAYAIWRRRRIARIYRDLKAEFGEG